MGGNIVAMMKQILRHRATGYVLTLVVIATVLLVPTTRETVFVAFGTGRDMIAALPGVVFGWIASIF